MLTTANGRAYKKYTGPRGERASSLKQAATLGTQAATLGPQAVSPCARAGGYAEAAEAARTLALSISSATTGQLYWKASARER